MIIRQPKKKLTHYSLACFLCLICLLISQVTIAAVYPMPKPGDDVIGEIFTIPAQKGDTLFKIGQRYGIGLHELMEANPKLKPENLRSKDQVIIPASYVLPKYRQGIVVNLAELRLYYFTPDGRYVMTYPVGLGRKDWRTPTTVTSVVRKEEDPIWLVPKSIKENHLQRHNELLPDKMFPGPKNPLGLYAIVLNKPGHFIHGNNAPTSIGKFVSSGCIRMNNADVEELFNIVQPGETVHIIHLTMKVGWRDHKLYLEAQVPVDLNQEKSEMNNDSMDLAIEDSTKNHTADIDWAKAEIVGKERSGYPVVIGQIKNVNSNSQFTENRLKHQSTQSSESSQTAESQQPSQSPESAQSSQSTESPQSQSVESTQSQSAESPQSQSTGSTQSPLPQLSQSPALSQPTQSSSEQSNKSIGIFDQPSQSSTESTNESSSESASESTPRIPRTPTSIENN